MLSSFWIAVTGLKANNEWLNITSDNIANANTVGYKRTRPIFQDLVLNDIMRYNAYDNSVSHTVYGGGVRIGSTYTIYTQGPFQETGINTDVAIEGDGFFVLRNPELNSYYYSRDGQFKITSGLGANGQQVMYLTHDSGLRVEGRNLETGAIEDIQIPYTMPPRATTHVYTSDGSNLNPSGDVPAVDFNPSDATTFNSTYTVQIYDTAGQSHDLGIFFKKLNPKIYDPNTGNTYYSYILDDNGTKYFSYNDNGTYYEAQAQNTTVTVTNTDNLILVASQVHVLDSVGNDSVADVYWYLDDNNQMHVLADINGTYYELGTSTTKLSQYTTVTAAEVSNFWETFIMLKGSDGNWYDIVDTQNNIIPKHRDGTTDTENDYKYALIRFDRNGLITGDTDIEVNYSNLNLPGNLQDYLELQDVNLNGLTQYPLDTSLAFQQDGYTAGNFVNLSIGSDGTVTAMYSNGQSRDLYRLELAYFQDLQSLQRDSANLFKAPPNTNPLLADAGVMSTVRSGTLEMSNVDIATELINMINAEKAYQANAKVVRTAQTILDTTLGLKQ
jgi:flagellar hook protein FlgE